MADHPNIAVIPPLALLVAILAAIGLERVLPLGVFPPRFWMPGLVVGITLLVASLALNISGARAFLAAGTPINPYKTSTTIVRSGAFKITRNPMYLGMLGLLLSLGPIFSIDWAVIATPVLWAVLHWGVVLREEAFLTAKFGADYQALMAETRRWL